MRKNDFVKIKKNGFQVVQENTVDIYLVVEEKNTESCQD